MLLPCHATVCHSERSEESPGKLSRQAQFARNPSHPSVVQDDIIILNLETFGFLPGKFYI